PERDHAPDVFADTIPLLALLAIALPKLQVVATKGMVPVHGLPRLAQGLVTDVHCIDAHVLWCQTAIQECHGNRVGLFTSGAGPAQPPEHGVLMRGEPLRHDISPEICEGYLVPEEPGFWDDHCFNKRVQLLF